MNSKHRSILKVKGDITAYQGSNKPDQIFEELLKEKYKIDSTIANKPMLLSCLNLLPHLDSNQDKQNQNLLYYRYTMGQF